MPKKEQGPAASASQSIPNATALPKAVPSEKQQDSDDEEEAEESGWRRPPVTWNGSTRTSYSFTDFGSGRSSGLDGDTTLSANTYLFKPWFAQASGTFSFRKSSIATSTGSGQGSDSETSLRNVTGSGSVALFPYTRFPLVVSYSKNRNDIESEGGGASSKGGGTSTRFGVNQSFRPQTETEAYNVSFDRYSNLNDDGREDSSQRVAGRFSGIYGFNSVSSDGSYDTHLSAAGDKTSSYQVSNRHELKSEYDDYGVVSTLGIMGTGYDPTFGQRASSRYVIAGSSGFWIPSEDMPLTLSGSLGLNGITVQNGGSESASSRTVSGNLGATYKHSNNLFLSAGGELFDVIRLGGGVVVLGIQRRCVVFRRPHGNPWL